LVGEAGGYGLVRRNDADDAGRRRLMTMVEPDAVTGAIVDDALAGDVEELRRALAGHPFPAQQDDLIAALLGRHEPARLSCRLSTLSRTAVYASLDDVLAAVEAAATVS
jgi:hypothetical protein